LRINGIDYGTNTSVIANTNYVITANATVPEGANSWVINCTNDSGTTTEQSVAWILNVDSIAPTVNLVSPANNTWTNDSTPDFVFNFTDDTSPTASCTLYINGTAYGTSSSVANNTNTIITANATLADGDYGWNVICIDRASNSNGTVSPFVLHVDTTLPTISISSPLSNSISNSTTLTITGTSTDTNLNYTNISIYNSTGDLVNSTINTSASWSVILTVGNNETYNISITSYDIVGNSNTAIISNITVNDTNAPIITSITSSTSGSTVTLSVTTDEFAVCRYSTSDIDYENMTNMSTTGALSHSKSFTFSSSASGTYYVRCADGNGNIMNVSNSTTYSITISSGSSSSSTTTTTVTTNVTTNVTQPIQPITQQPEEQPTEEVVQPTAAPGTVAEVEVTNEIAKFVASPVAGQPLIVDILTQAPAIASTSGISKISIVSSVSYSDAQISIKPIFEKPAEVSEPAKKVLKYIQINIDIPSNNIQSAKLTFVVTKADLKKMNIDVSTLKLLRYVNGEWQELSTELAFEDLKSYTFEAITPGFSYFAIAGEEIKAPAETPKVTTQVTEEEPAVTVEQPVKKEESPLGLILLLVIILVVVYIYLTSKKR